MTKRIILLSDGTGNSAASIWRTNVWRMFQAIDLAGPDQIAAYDDGIGTSSFKPLAWFGGIFGYGLKRNVIEGYKFLCRNYAGLGGPSDQPRPEIYAFGFSRGAFTIRVLIDLLMSEGMVRYNGSERDLHRSAAAAYGSFRKKKRGAIFERAVHFIRSFFKRGDYHTNDNLAPPAIRFIGLWDTVSAYGLPIAEMTKFFSIVIWSLELAGTRLDARVQRACHALSLDEERTTFHPLLWTEDTERSASLASDDLQRTRDERISQVWFAGVHSNVGGGYPDDALAHIPLIWMMKEAADCGLRFKPDAEPDSISQLSSVADKDGRMYDSRSGFAGSYRYGPRKLDELCNAKLDDDGAYRNVHIDTPKIHHTVFERMLAGVFPYAPLGLPARYCVVDKDRRIRKPEDCAFENIDQAKVREKRQELVWNRVFLRSLAYFIKPAAASFLLFYPFFYPLPPSDRRSPLVWVSDLVNLAGAFLPDFSRFWINFYAETPGIFLSGVIVFLFGQQVGRLLKGSIADEIRAVWRRSLLGQIEEPERTPIYRIRTSRLFQLVRNLLKDEIIPATTMILFVVFLLGFSFRAAFYITDAAGFYCRNSSNRAPLGNKEVKFTFDPSSICNKSGVVLEEGKDYEFYVRENSDLDGKAGRNSIALLMNQPADVSRLIYDLTWPIRRTIRRPWFTVIGRVGRAGADEFFFEAGADKTLLIGRYHAPRTGEFFIYLNAIPLPFTGFNDFFPHIGTAEVVVKFKDPIGGSYWVE
jgi:uncharacterized protein (DUF2235 family)